MLGQSVGVAFDAAAIFQDSINTVDSVGVPISQGSCSTVAAQIASAERFDQIVGDSLGFHCRMNVGIDNKVWFVHDKTSPNLSKVLCLDQIFRW